MKRKCVKCCMTPDLRQSGWGPPHAGWECPVCGQKYWEDRGKMLTSPPEPEAGVPYMFTGIWKGRFYRNGVPASSTIPVMLPNLWSKWIKDEYEQLADLWRNYEKI